MLGSDRMWLPQALAISERSGLVAVDAECVLLAVFADPTSVVGALSRDQAARVRALDGWASDRAASWGALIGLVREAVEESHG